jgi:lysophospholipase L1-like esterase
MAFALIEGTAQFIWWRLELRALQRNKSRGQEMLRNDAINFMKEPHGVYGYTLKPGYYNSQLWINEQGFPQQDKIPVERRPGYLRVVCLGESTTFGNSSVSNYPAFLREILQRDGRGFKGYEVINGGVPGWVSDQIELRVRYEIARYKPDVVILYAGWNDFQSYDPLAGAPQVSYFDVNFGSAIWKQRTTSWLKSVALLSAWYNSRRPAVLSTTGPNSPARCYRFLVRSLDGIVSDFRQGNPKVRVFVCTLVGRWPEGTPQEWAKIPAVWWMTQHHISPEGMVPLVKALNDQLRDFAQTRGLALIDTAASFQTLDRTKLQWDWAHMTSDGYELVAWTMFSALQKEGIVQGQEDPRYSSLLSKYTVPELTAGAGN